MAASTAAPARKSVAAAPLVVGERVTVGSMQIRGVLKFAGETEFADGEWMGIELDTPSGKNDGSVKGVSYFTCRPNHGLFVRRSALTREEAPKAKAASSPLKKSTTSKLKESKDAAAGTPPASPAPGAAADAKAGGKVAASPRLSVSQEGLKPARGAEATPGTPQSSPGAGRPAAGPLQKEGTKSLKSAKSFPKEAQAKRQPESPPPPPTGEAESPPPTPGEAEEEEASRRPRAKTEERAPAAAHAGDQNGSAPAAAGAGGKVNGTGATAAAAPRGSRSLAELAAVAAAPRPSRLVHLEDPAGVERQAAQQALAVAAEDHDAAGIRAALRRAKTAGVDEAEIASAERVLSYETQSWLTQEVEGICSTMKRLKQTVDDVEARAGAAGGLLVAGGPRPAAARLPPGESPDGEDAWLSSLGQQLERRVWEGLEQRVEAAIQGAVSRATRELLAAAAEVGQLRGQAVPAQDAPPPAAPQVPRAVPGQYGSYSWRWRRAARRIMRLRFTASALSTGDVRSFTAANAVGALEASLAEDDEFERIMAQWGQKGSRQSVVTREGLPPVAAAAGRAPPPPIAERAPPAPAEAGAKWPGREVVRASLSLALRGALARIQMQDGTARKSAASMTRSSLRQAYALSSCRLTRSLTKRKTVTFPDDIVAASVPEEAGTGTGEIQAATRIQAQFRGHRSREQAARGLEDVEAATKIQAQFRGHRERESVLLARLDSATLAGAGMDEVEAATKIQAQFRGHRDRESVLLAQTELTTFTGASTDEVEAATKIQARYRGHRERESVACLAYEVDLEANRQVGRKALMCLLLAEPQGLPTRAALSATTKDVQAATVIQAQFRGHRERHRISTAAEGANLYGDSAAMPEDPETALGEARSAVDDIEACGRRMEAARAALQQKVDGAASLVQARYRGLCGRREAAQRAEGVQKLQQAFRRMQVNRKAGQSADFYRVALLMRKRNQAFVDTFLDIARKGGRDAEQGLSRDGFLAAAAAVHSPARLSGAQAQALWRGFEEGTGASSMGLRVFCNICEAVVEGDSEAAEYADMDLEQWASMADAAREEQGEAEEDDDEDAEKTDCDGDDDFPTGSRSAAAGLGEKWANHFRQGMNQDGFVAIMRGVRPTPSKAQLKAIWDAHASRSPATKASPDFVDFSLMAEAIVTDAHAAAEFADLSVEHYLMLGANGAEAAAAEIQAAFRGNTARKELKQRQDAALKIQTTFRGTMARTRTLGDEELKF